MNSLVTTCKTFIANQQISLNLLWFDFLKFDFLHWLIQGLICKITRDRHSIERRRDNCPSECNIMCSLSAEQQNPSLAPGLVDWQENPDVHRFTTLFGGHADGMPSGLLNVTLPGGHRPLKHAYFKETITCQHLIGSRWLC